MFDSLWPEKFRPSTFEDIVLDDFNRKSFEKIKEAKECPNLLFVGHSGIGKTCAAKIIATDILDAEYLYLNGSDAGIDTVRYEIVKFAKKKSLDGSIKLVIIDECDGFSAEGMRALRNTMEEYAYNTRFILTANSKHRIIPALQSRCQYFDLTPPIKQVAKRCLHILKEENIEYDKDAEKGLIKLIRAKFPDMRTIINCLQQFSISGTLEIRDTALSDEFIGGILNLLKKKDSLKIRKYLIENDSEFNNDYDAVYRGVFDALSNTKDFPDNVVKQWMVILVNYWAQSQTFMDQEINCFACFVEMESIL